jgi:hypothetical protein
MATDNACVELAGFAAAYALCFVARGQTLIPLAVSQRGTTTARVNRLAGGTPDDIAAQGRRWLDENPDAADRAVTVLDAYVTISAVRMDALVLEIRSYSDPITPMRMAVPYRHARGDSRFAVHRPKFIVAQLGGHDANALTQAFFRGVFRHEPGSRIWNACVDQSR